jgi:hypothetical protein
MQKEIQPRIPWDRSWAEATNSFLDDIDFGLCSKEELRHRAADAMVAGNARKLGRHFEMIAQERREKLLEILSSPRHLAKVAAKAERHAAIVASLPILD